MAVKTPPDWRREAVEIPLATLIELFVVSKQIEGRSQKTLDWYRAHLERYAEFVGNGKPASLEDLSLTSARAFVQRQL